MYILFYVGKPHQSLVHRSIFMVTLFTRFLSLMSVPCIIFNASLLATKQSMVEGDQELIQYFVESIH